MIDPISLNDLADKLCHDALCIWPGCRESVTANACFCTTHWNILPENIQQDVITGMDCPFTTIEDLTNHALTSAQRAFKWISEYVRTHKDS